MWSALENAAFRESLPTPLMAGDSIHGVRISGQLNRGRYNLHHLGHRRSTPFLVKQFYSINTDAFLRWQNEARFIAIPPVEDCVWPMEEWRGGLILPFPEGKPLDQWLRSGPHPFEKRMRVATMLARTISRLHASGIAHRGISPSSIHVGGHAVYLSDFGSSRCSEWDDFWRDSPMLPRDAAYASSEALHCRPGACTEDIYSFGCILHLLLTGTPVFGIVKKKLRALTPECIPPDSLPEKLEIPADIRALESACLATDAQCRPSMAEIVSALEAHVDACHNETPLITVPSTDATVAGKQKVMIFIKEPDLAIELIECALRTATQRPSLLLFVGLIPNNLPSGHTERFKGSLFRRLAQGLTRCRTGDIHWSLRILEHVDPRKAEEAMTCHYQPDTVI